MQCTGTVQCECMYIGSEHLDEGFASETATRTRHGDVGLVAAAISKLPVAVVSPRVQGAIVLDGVMGGVTLPPGGNLGDAGKHRQLHKVVALGGVAQAQLPVTVVAASMHSAIAAQDQGAVVTLGAAVQCQLDHSFAGN